MAAHVGLQLVFWAVNKGLALQPGGPADGPLDSLDFPPQIPWCRVILWTDPEHTSAIKIKNNKPWRLIFFQSVER